MNDWARITGASSGIGYELANIFAAKVAEKGYRGLMKGRRVVVPGVMNQITSFFARSAPHRLSSAIVKRIH
jgi:short-subunit dehydrogenase